MFFKFWGNLRVALAFLTRFPHTHTCTEHDLKDALSYFFLASLILGLILTLPILIITKLVAPNLPAPLMAALSAWIWLGLEIYLTRALHWDGLADLIDALGSNKTGPKFWAIIKDSRLGTFGALGLILVLAGQFLTLTIHLTLDNYLCLILAPVFARQAPFWLAKDLPAYQNSTLGAFFCQAVAENKRLHQLAALILISTPLFLSILFGLPQILFLLATEFLLLNKLKKIALTYGGLSGDFCGAAIELSQLNFLLLTI